MTFLDVLHDDVSVYVRTCASIFSFSAIFCSWSVSFPFLFERNGFDSFFFSLSSSFDCGLCQGNHLAFLWDSFDTSYSAYPRRPFVYCTAVLSTSSSTSRLVRFYVCKRLFRSHTHNIRKVRWNLNEQKNNQPLSKVRLTVIFRFYELDSLRENKMMKESYGFLLLDVWFSNQPFFLLFAQLFIVIHVLRAVATHNRT